MKYCLWQKCGKISSSESGGRDSGNIRLCLADALAFIICKEEERVFAIEQMRYYNWPSYVGPELIEMKRRNGIGWRVKVIFGVEIGVAQELVDRSMKLFVPDRKVTLITDGPPP